MCIINPSLVLWFDSSNRINPGSGDHNSNLKKIDLRKNEIQYLPKEIKYLKDLEEFFLDKYSNENSISFEEFTKKHYDKIKKKFEIGDEDLKDAIDEITRLNPKPGNSLIESTIELNSTSLFSGLSSATSFIVAFM